MLRSGPIRDSHGGFPGRACLVLTALLGLGALPVVTQQAGAPAKPKRQEPARINVKWKPAFVPADAIAYGVSLEEAAAASVKKWAEGYVRGVMRDIPVDPRGAMAAVDQQYPGTSDAVRDAVTFLVFCHAYRDEFENQRTLSFRLRDIDRETVEITRKLQLMWRAQQNRSASATQRAGMGETLRIDEEQRKMESQLREFADERQLKAALLEASRKKVDNYLRVLAAAHPRMKGVHPSVLKGVE